MTKKGGMIELNQLLCIRTLIYVVDDGRCLDLLENILIRWYDVGAAVWE